MPAAVLPYSPDWGERVTERLEWLTDVLPARDGSEQRVRLRNGPRRSLEYDVILGGDAQRVLAENRLHAAQDRQVIVPDWLNQAWLTQAAAAAATTLQVDDARGLSAGMAALMVSGTDTAAVTVSAVAGNTATLSAGLAAAWPMGARVAPSLACTLMGATTLRYQADDVARATLELRCNAEAQITAASDAADYLGRPVLLPQTNWSEAPEGEYDMLVDELDNLVGRPRVEARNGMAGMQRNHRWLLESRGAVMSFRSWLAARAGRLTPFWHPSNHDDVRVVAAIASGATAITVERRGWAEMWAAGAAARYGRSDLMIVSTAGTRWYRRITNAAVASATTETLTISAALGTELALGAVAMVSVMRLVRLASDAVEIVHHTDGVAEVALGLVTLHDAEAV